MKFISYSNGKTSFKSRANTGTRLHRVRGIDFGIISLHILANFGRFAKMVRRAFVVQLK